MIDLERMGKNIKALRNAFGETQEELGEILGIEKNTVSYYENAKREPNKEMISKIAKHYMISVEELMFCDISNIGTIFVDDTVFLKNIDIIFPIVISDSALNNPHFTKAYKQHKEFYDGLKNLNIHSFDSIEVCVDEYLEAYSNEQTKVEASANCIAIWSLLLLMMKVPELLKTKSAALMQIAAKNKETKDIVDNPDEEFEKDALEAMSEMNDPETIKLIKDMMISIKRSHKLSDLADYYLAMKYILGIIDNDLGWEFNRRVGLEMLNSFASVGNKYAVQYLKLSLSSIGQSSQIVDDK